jgi:hypothetical protein
MIRRLCLLLLCALVPIGVLTGCGGSGSTTTTKRASTTPTTTVPLSVRLQKAIAVCKKEVAASAYIPAAQKPAGEADCQGVKSGNVADVSAVRTLLKNACVLEVAEKVPAAQKAPATAACKRYY